MNNPFDAKNDLSKLENSAYRYIEDGNEHAKENAKEIMNKAKEKSKQGLSELVKSLQNKNQVLPDNGNSPNKVKGKALRKAGDMVRSAVSKGKGTKIASAGKTVNKAKKFGKIARVAKFAGKGAKLARFAKKGRTALKLAQIGRVALTGGAVLAGGPVGIALFVGSTIAPFAIEAIWKNREKIYSGGKSIVSKLSSEDIDSITEAKQGKVGDTVESAKSLKIEGDNGKTLLETDSEGKILQNEFTEENNLAFYQEQDGEKSMLYDEEWEREAELESESEKIVETLDRKTNLETDVKDPGKDSNPLSPPETLTKKNQNNAVNSNTVVPENIIPEAKLPKEADKSAVTPSAITPAAETESITSKDETVSGVDVVRGSLQNLITNNPDSSIAESGEFLQDTLDIAEENSFEIEANPQTPQSNEKINFNRNEAGSSLMDLFEEHSKDGEHLTTRDYNLQRRGRSYFLKDREGNVLMEARKTAFGTKIAQNNLNPSQERDLSFLKEDLEEGKGITGGFKPSERPIEAVDTIAPGASMIRLYDENASNLAPGEKLQTNRYDISKQDNLYQLSDKEGNVLFAAKKTKAGQITTKGKLGSQLKQDFKTLQNDIAQGNVIGGAFKLGAKALGKAFMASPAGAVVNLFKQFSPDQQTVETQDYSISRKNNLYYLKDRVEGNTLMVARENSDGSFDLKTNGNKNLASSIQQLTNSMKEGGTMPKAFEPITGNESSSLVNRFEKYDKPVAAPREPAIAGKGMER